MVKKIKKGKGVTSVVVASNIKHKEYLDIFINKKNNETYNE